MNALKTGIHAKSLVLPSEKLADLQLLIDEYYQHHHPTTPEARALIDELIRCEWLQRRLHTAETQLWAFDNKDAWTPDNEYPLGQTASRKPKAFGQLQWRINCTRRASQRALQDLKQLEAEAAAETSAPSPAPAPPAVVEPAAPPSLIPSPQTTSPQIGFVPSTPLPTPPQPAPQDPYPGPVPVVTSHPRIR
ncbi:MAG: hypothetical protein ABSC05_25450 [Candidatus Solibacter sp.]